MDNNKENIQDEWQLALEDGHKTLANYRKKKFYQLVSNYIKEVKKHSLAIFVLKNSS